MFDHVQAVVGEAPAGGALGFAGGVFELAAPLPSPFAPLAAGGSLVGMGAVDVPPHAKRTRSGAKARRRRASMGSLYTRVCGGSNEHGRPPSVSSPRDHPSELL
jgi:hypothetical protein